MGVPLLLFSRQQRKQKTYIDKVKELSPLVFWPLNDAAGSVAYDRSGNGYNGAYDGVTLGQPGQFGQTCPRFDGTTSYVNIYSAGLAGAFNPNECTALMWLKPYTGAMTDGSARALLRLQVDTDNRLTFQRSTTNNIINVVWEASNTLESVSVTISTETWHCIVITVSKTADQVKAYVDGAQSGSTQTGLQTWVGSLASNVCIIGAQALTPTAVWNGWLQYAAIWTRPLSALEIANLYNFF